MQFFDKTRSDKQVVLYAYIWIHAFLYLSNTFISNVRLKLAKNERNAKQHPEAELLLFENYSHCSSTLSSKSNRTNSKK